MDIKGMSIGTVLSIATTASGGAWWASENLAQKDEVQIAGLKADVALD